MTRRDTTWLANIPVAHRGLHDAGAGVPENSLAAFAAARDAGYAIELDIRADRDGRALVFHDATLDRLTGTAGRLIERGAAELAALRLLGTAERLPSLAEVLALVAGQVPILVEIKRDPSQRLGSLEAAVRDLLTGYAGPVAVQSFSPLVVDWFRKAAPELPRGQIATKEVEDLTAEQQAMLDRLLEEGHGAPEFVAYDIEHLPSSLTRRAKDSGLPVLTWTVRSPEQRARARQFADNVIFEAWRPGLDWRRTGAEA